MIFEKPRRAQRARRGVLLLCGLCVLCGSFLFAQDDEPALRGPVVSFDEKGPTIEIAVADGVKDVKLVSHGQTIPFEPFAGRLRAHAAAGAYDVIASTGSLAHGELRPLPGPEARKLTFCALGDSGFPGRGNGEATDEQVAIAKIVEDQDPDLVIHTGDVIYLVGQPKSFDALFFKPYARLLGHLTFLTCLGNHDVKTKDGIAELEEFSYPPNEHGNRAYSFDAANVHFTCLDSNAVLHAESTSAFLGSKQGRWLVQDLSSAKKDWKIVYMHHPLYAVSKVRAWEMDKVRQILEPTLDEARVDLVVAGHEHYYHRTPRMKDGKPAASGILHIVTGGGGAPLYDGEPKDGVTARYASRFHAVRFDVDRGAMHIRALGAADGGKTECFDELTIQSRKFQ